MNATTTNTDTIVWDFFDRAEGKNFSKDDEPRMWQFELSSDLTLAEALAAARSGEDLHFSRPLGKGSARSGCFQVQNRDGIWQQVDDRKIDLSSHRKAARVMFKTWDQMEAEERTTGSVSWSL